MTPNRTRRRLDCSLVVAPESQSWFFLACGSPLHVQQSRDISGLGSRCRLDMSVLNIKRWCSLLERTLPRRQESFTERSIPRILYCKCVSSELGWNEKNNKWFIYFIYFSTMQFDLIDGSAAGKLDRVWGWGTRRRTYWKDRQGKLH